MQRFDKLLALLLTGSIITGEYILDEPGDSYGCINFELFVESTS
jgi:hypothetical protein